jgi:hypothetical protein
VFLPQFQDITVGDAQKLGKNGPVLRAAVAEPEHALVFRSDDGNWVWARSASWPTGRGLGSSVGTASRRRGTHGRLGRSTGT